MEVGAGERGLTTTEGTLVNSAGFELMVDSMQDETIVGTNCGVSDIPLGTTFTAAVRVRAGNENRRQPVDEVAMALKLLAVNWFGRDIAAVPGGHSAGLKMSGPGLEWLVSTLRDLPPGDSIVLIPNGGAIAVPDTGRRQ